MLVIQCAVDFSEPFERALEYALGLAERLRGARRCDPCLPLSDLRGRVRLRGSALLSAGETCGSGSATGSRSSSQKSQCTGLSHLLLLGSVAERVVRASEVPVLTIRSAGAP